MSDIINRSITKYNLVINNFEGPLDLLLHLISKNKLTIFEISLSEITDKYIDYLKQMESMDLEITSEFIVMASTLLEIKARKLLPEIEEKEDEEVITEEDIIKKLIEYKKYKEFSIKINEMYKSGFGFFSKDPEKIKFEKKIEIERGSIDKHKLYELFNFVIVRNENRINKKADEINRLTLTEKITVRDKVRQISKYLTKNKKMVFGEVFSKENCSNIEIVTAFLGVLELSKLKEVTIEQKQLFEDILVKNLKK